MLFDFVLIYRIINIPVLAFFFLYTTFQQIVWCSKNVLIENIQIVLNLLSILHVQTP